MSSRSSVVYNPIHSAEEVSEAADADSIRLSIEAPGCELPEGKIELQSLDNENNASAEHSTTSVVNGDSYAICGKEIGFLKACFKPTPIEECNVTLLDVIMLAFAAVTYVTDIGTDIWLVVTYYRNNDLEWMKSTLMFLFLPSIFGFSQTFLLIWSGKIRTMKAMSCLPQLMPGGLIYFLIGDLHIGYEAWRTGDNSAGLIEKLKAPEYRLFEAFGEAAPQLTLQLYIMLQDTDKIMTIQWVSSAISLMSLSLAIVSDYKMKYLKNGRFKIPHLGFALCFGWHLLTVLARTIALAICSNVLPGALLLVICFHAMAALIFFFFTAEKNCQGNQSSNFVIMTLFSSYTSDSVHNSRLNYFFFQTIIYLENVIMLLLWFFSPKSGNAPLWLRYFCSVSIIAGYLLGVLLQIVYYVDFHPKNFHSDETKHIKICVPWKEWVQRMSRSEIEIRRWRKEMRKWREAKTNNAEEIQRQKEEIQRRAEKIKWVENVKIRGIEQKIEEGKMIQGLEYFENLRRKLEIREEEKEIKRLKKEIISWKEETRILRETREIRIEESGSNEQRHNEQESGIELERWHQNTEIIEGSEEQGIYKQESKGKGSGIEERETDEESREIRYKDQESKDQGSNEKESIKVAERWHQSGETKEGIEEQGIYRQESNIKGSGIEQREADEVGREIRNEDQTRDSKEQESEKQERWHQKRETDEGSKEQGSEGQGNNEQGSGVKRETRQVGAEVGREEQGCGTGERETTEANFDGGCAEQGINGQDDRAEVINQYDKIGLQVFCNIMLIFAFFVVSFSLQAGVFATNQQPQFNQTTPTPNQLNSTYSSLTST